MSASILILNSNDYRTNAQLVFDALKASIMHENSLILYAYSDLQHLENTINQLQTEPQIVINTSGTTGQPKTIYRNINDILDKKGRGDFSDIWLLTYEPWRWAGISVMLHTIKNNSQMRIPDSLEPNDLISILPHVTHISLTPTKFKQMAGLMNPATNIRQVTFGGEWASQSLLDTAKKCFPFARITHIYATSEAGDICAVSDGMEGYPRHSILKRATFVNNELYIDGKPTGDFWEEKEDRYYFKGRSQDFAIIGGESVSLTEIKLKIEAIDDIIHATPYMIPSPLLGSLIGLKYVGNIEAHDLKKQLQKLPKIMRPVKIEQINKVETTSAGKSKRI